VQRTPITLKLALTLAVPIVVLAFATTLGVRVAADERAEVRRQTALARAAIGPAGVLSTLQNERIWVTIDMLDFADDFPSLPVSSNDEAFGQTDAAVADLRERVTGGDDGIVAGAFARPVGGLDELARIRSDIEAFRVGEADLAARIEFVFDTWDRYTALLGPFYDATTSISGEIEDARLRQGARLSDDVARGIEAFSQLGERTVVISLLTDNGADTRDEIAELSRLRSDMARHGDAIASAPAPYAAIPSISEAQQMIGGLQSQAEEAVTTGRIGIDNLFGSVLMPEGQGLFALQDDVHRIIEERADELESAAEGRQVRLVVLAVAGLAFVIVLNLLVSRSITGPLRSLTGQATELAQRRLPAAVEQLLDVPVGADVPVPEVEPVTVDTGDELADVAGALNAVQASVVDLAARQAVYRRNISDLFVSLNGRNQELLRRQIGLIGELDSPLVAPTAQASYSQLDHLATQMRRNTDSLLAVAGLDARRVWQAPVDVDEVVRYALAAVVDRRRLVVQHLEPAAVAGANANDIVHLLAELIESALVLSAADDRPVEIRGGPKPETGGYWLALVDFGGALTPREVQSANRELAGEDPPPATAAGGAPGTPAAPDTPARSGGTVGSGGHAMAAHLAGRAGVTVRFDSSAGWGVTVTVDIPGNLVVRRPSDADDPRQAGPAPASRARPLTGPTMAPLPHAGRYR
jgi:HAMP domain-containing protein